MLVLLTIGITMIMGNMFIQVLAVVILVRLLLKGMASGRYSGSLVSDVRLVSSVILVLLAGHLLQFTTWALVFVSIGQFNDLATAFYHSTVNFTSLGYGDIVMDERWRLLGALEAANGVLMFGLSAGTILAVMNRILMRRTTALQEIDS